MSEFFIYAGMMFAVMELFILLAMRYEYVDNTEVEKEEEEEENVLPSRSSGLAEDGNGTATKNVQLIQ
jgi:hypothetical protein